MSDSRQPKRGLGRGLSALMADLGTEPGGLNEAGETGRQVLPIEQIMANPDQPRRHFEPEALQELAASLRARGVLQPLIVRPHPNEPGLYQIVAGERRWRAAQIAQLHELPVIIRDLDDTEMLEIALIENIQRADLNAIEEAASFRQLMDRFGHTQEQLAEALNKSRSHIANAVRLLTLPEPVQAWVKEGKLTAGHARALITHPDPVALARRVIDRGMSVRETEAMLRKPSQPAAGKSADRAAKDADTRALETDLSAQLGLPVSIVHAGEGGQLVLRYRNLDDLDRLCRLLSA